MKKLIWVPIITFISLVLLEFVWYNKAYQTYQDKTLIEIEKALSVSIGKELSLRQNGRPHNPQSPKVAYRVSDTLPEGARLKGDTLNMTEMKKKHMGMEYHEIIQQIFQDLQREKGNFLYLPNLDSIFRVELAKADIRADYSLSLLGKDTVAMETVGTLTDADAETVGTRLFPIGIRGLQFIKAEADIHPSTFLQNIFYLLVFSTALAVVVMGCVAFLLITIRKKNREFRLRESSVNGTVHDLKSPLNSIIALMSFLKQRVNQETDRELIEKTMIQARGMVGEIEELLITARKDRQSLYLQKKDTDLVKLIRAAYESVSAQYGNKPHSFSVEPEQTEVIARVDTLYATNVIRNLIENALKYSDAGVQVLVHAVAGNRFTELTVEDTGWGIEPKYRKKIFTQFFQAPHNGQRSRQGYGVGLAYVRYIMKAHGGSIRLESVPGEGSRFICRFPTC